MTDYSYQIFTVIDDYGNNVYLWSITSVRNGFFTSTNTYGGGEEFVDACEVDC